MTRSERLDPRTVREAVDAWCRGYRHTTDDEAVGKFIGDSADTIIERKVRQRDNPKLYRAYETAVRDAAVRRLGLTGRPPRGRSQYYVQPEERDEILTLLESGLSVPSVAERTGRSMPTVRRIIREDAA